MNPTQKQFSLTDASLNKANSYHYHMLADREWLDDATKTIGLFWRRKNARRNGLITEEQTDATVVVR